MTHYRLAGAREVLSDERLRAVIEAIQRFNLRLKDGDPIPPYVSPWERGPDDVTFDGAVLAVTLLWQDLENGASLEDAFGDSVQAFGPPRPRFGLSVTPIATNTFDISIGCFPGPCVGDAGEWRVVFSDNGARCIKGGRTLIS